MSATPAAARALAVLKRLASSAEPMAAGQLAAQLDIPRASLYRLLNTLADHGFVTAVTETNRWALGVAAYELGWGYLRQDPLQRSVRPLLEKLVDATGHSAHFTTLHGTEVVYVVEERARHRPSLVTHVGVRLPAHLTASGRAMLALLGSAQITALYPSGTALSMRGDQPAMTLKELKEELRRTRERGFAVENQLVTPGLSSVAHALIGPGDHPLGAITLTHPCGDADPERLAEAIRRTLTTLSARLGLPRSHP